jgi:hypothetical protein
MRYLQDLQTKVQVLGSKVNKEVTFNPKTNKLNSEMNKKVEDLRKNYNLVKEHSKSPIKEKNKENAKEEVAKARHKILEFLDRNNNAQKQKEIHLKKLKEEFDEAYIESIQPLTYNSNRISSALLKESTKYKDKDLWERQKVFMLEKEKKIEYLKKERDEEEVQDQFRFHKETNKKYLNSKIHRAIDQSAKTDMTGRGFSAQRSPLHSEIKNDSAISEDRKKYDPSNEILPEPEPDYSSVFINLDPEGFNSILFKLKAEEEPQFDFQLQNDIFGHNDERLDQD